MNYELTKSEIKIEQLRIQSIIFKRGGSQVNYAAMDCNNIWHYFISEPTYINGEWIQPRYKRRVAHQIKSYLPPEHTIVGRHKLLKTKSVKAVYKKINEATIKTQKRLKDISEDYSPRINIVHLIQELQNDDFVINKLLVDYLINFNMELINLSNTQLKEKITINQVLKDKFNNKIICELINNSETFLNIIKYS